MLPLTMDPIGSRNAPKRRGEISPILYAGWIVTVAFLLISITTPLVALKSQNGMKLFCDLSFALAKLYNTIKFYDVT